MLFVVFVLPAVVGGIRVALAAGNAVLDHVEGARAARAEQQRCRTKTGGDPVHLVVEMVTDKDTADALLRDDRVVRGRAAATQFRHAGVI